jgi:predicted nuclease of predicted toxin-antitoxin system
MAKSKDREIFDYAEKNDMILLSVDLDFGTTGKHPFPQTLSNYFSIA